MRKPLTLEQTTDTALILLLTGLAGFLSGDIVTMTNMSITFLMISLSIGIIRFRQVKKNVV